MPLGRLCISIFALFFGAVAVSVPAHAQTACHTLHSGAPVPEGFGAPYNALTATQELLISVTCTTSGVTVRAGAGNPLHYVYHQGYAWNPGTQAWQQVPFTGAIMAEGLWVVGSAEATLARSAAALAQENYVVAFICIWTGTSWQCGCRDAECAQPLWQLQTFTQTGDGTGAQSTGASGGGTGGTTGASSGDTGASGDWWNISYPYRVPLSVTADTVLLDKPVEVSVNLDALLQQAGGSGSIPADGVAAVEVNVAGEVVDAQVPVQYSPAQDELTLLLKGDMAGGATRHYEVYFATQNVGGQQAIITVEDNVTDEDQVAVKMTTPYATYFYQKAAAGFSSILDQEGNDWIGFRPCCKSAGEFRGIPNMVHRGDGGSFFHPGFNNSETEIVESGPVKVTLLSTGRNGKWKGRWEVYPTYAKMTVEGVGNSPYWFLYEGTPGGKLDTGSDYSVRSNGERANAGAGWKGDLPDPEWVYFEDSALARMIYLIHLDDDTHVDSFYSMRSEMTVFGFGRDGGSKFMREAPNRFIIGLADIDSPEHAMQIIASALAEPSAQVGSAQRR